VQELITGTDVWAEVGPRFRRAKGRRQAAIAFTTEAAYELLALRAGDIVVVNAGRRVLRIGATNPKVLARWLADEVEVFVHDGLHAKVLVTPSLAFAGSANASYAAQGHSDEAVLATDDGVIVRATRRYIDTLADASFKLDSERLKKLEQEYRAPSGGGITGLTAKAPPAPLVPSGKLTMHVAAVGESVSAAGMKHYEDDRRRIPRQRGLRLDFVEAYLDGIDTWREGHLLLVVWDAGDDEVATVGRISEIRPRHKLANVYYHYRDGSERLLSEVKETLRNAGYRWTGYKASVASQGKVRAILAQWALDAGVGR
jgi:hypothetical protein